jgi:hypothetical protein
MKRVTVIAILLALLIGCEARVEIRSEPEEGMSEQETVEFFSENDITSFAESFRNLDHFEYWSLRNWESESYLFNVGFEQDIIIGVNEFQVTGDDFEELLIKMKELREKLQVELSQEDQNGVSENE